MKIAIIGSRSINIDEIGKYLPENISEIVSGGAKGVDTAARNYAIENKIPLKEFLPDYKRYGRGAPLKRNLEIVKYADMVIAFWDGRSRGTKFVIDNSEKMGKPIKVFIL